MVMLSLTNMFGVGAVAEIVFALVTLLIAFFAIKSYKLTRVPSYKIFGLSFLFISCAYLFKSLVNLLVFWEYISPGAIANRLSDISTLFGYGVLIHIVLMLLALLVLINLTMKLKNKFVFLMLVVLTFFPLALTTFHYSIFYALSSFFLFVLAGYFFVNYKRVKKPSAFMVFAGFSFIFLAHFLYIFIEVRNLFFVFGHIAEFIGYFLLLINYVWVLRR